MDDHRFDHLALLFGRATVRRRLLAGLAISPFAGLVAGRLGDETVAKKRKHKKRKPKATPNEFGCLEIGDTCQSEEQCCSGICSGKKGKRKCVAHNTGICGPDSGFCGTGVAAYCHSSGARCWQTTGKAGFCGFLGTEEDHCRDCARDADCEDEFGPGAACIVLHEGACAGTCANTGGIACVPTVV